jgi:outer membrane receptor protein involved in Fe transport
MIRKMFLLLSLGLCSFFFVVSSARAQFNASIQGTVLDPKGAAVPDVKVSATNQETGIKYETVAGKEGFYKIAGLPPGRYTVAVEAPGFKKSLTKEVVVTAESTRGLDLKLELGAVSETVTVTGQPEGVQTESASVSGAITSKMIQDLPVTGRDPYELLRLTPGVFGDGARDGKGNAIGLPNSTGPGGSNASIFQIENQVPVSANGQRVSANNFTIDGVSVNSLAFGGAAVITPGEQSVQEITVLSSSYSAEDGRNSGAQIKVVSKSGTNNFHGGGFFKYQDPNFNAFNKYGGFDKAPPTRVNNNFRQFGGNLGGPVLKDKLFFFFSYEGLRSRNVDTVNAWIETPQYRAAVLAQRPNSIANKILSAPGNTPRIIQVIPTTCAAANFSAANCAQVAGGLDIGSITGAQGQYVSLGNPTGGGLDGVPDIQFAQLALPSTTRGNQYNPRVDLYLGRNQFAVSSYFTQQDNIGSDAGGRSRPNQDLTIRPLNSAVALAWILTLSPTLLNEARFNFTRFSFNQVSSNSAVNFGIPRIEIEGLPFDRIRFGADRGETTPAIFAENTFNFRDNLSKNMGRHALKFGVNISREQDNNNLAGGARPLYSLSGLWNFANDTPIFESINANPNTGAPADAQRYFRSTTYGYFGQDDWKLRPNFTLTLGLRYEYFAPLTEAKGRLSNLILGSNFLQNAKVMNVSQLYPPDRNNFAPRLGFAWSPHETNSKLAVRGGFGVAYNRIPDVLFANSRANPPLLGRFGLCCGTAATDFGSPFAGGSILYALGSSNSIFSFPVNPALAFGIDPANGGVCGNKACTFDQAVEIYGAPQNLRTPYVFTYSLDTEYQLPWNLIGAIGYQGSAGHKLIRLLNQNFLGPPNNAFFAVYFPTSDENSNFNALNLRLTRSFSKGLQFQANYRWSKSIDQLSNEGPGAVTNQTDPAHHKTERGPSDYDATHYFTLYGLWDLPIYRNRKDWMGKIVGGWQVDSILTFHSGFPWTPNTCIIQSVPITGAFNICPTRPIGALKPGGTSASTSTFITTGGNFPGGGLQYFDVSHPGPPGIGRNSQRGPRYFNIDMSLVKRFGLPAFLIFGEGTNIELRGNFFNIFNKLNVAPLGFNAPETRIEDSHFGVSPKGLAGRVIELQAKFTF